ncbi:MAG: hypothetical protein KGS61_02230 [Verrucomicrobia bacterium]|nr:hypothetical protein [Verrucomicrobiota bacterium]
MKTILYIDGFNLFYSAVKGTPLPWLNPVALVARAFPKNQIIGTKYFTAKVSALPNNPGQPIRQMIFWRALRTLLAVQFPNPLTDATGTFHKPPTW